MFFLRQKPKAGMSAQEAVQGAKAGAITVIDVRDGMELANSGIAEGALHMPLMRLRDMADPRHPDYHPALKTTGKIAVYCASGARSHSAASVLRQLGYEDVHNIGGLSHWVQAGGKVIRT
ncbi:MULTISPECIES: rhodanese-like domain-containing protein [Shimia]|uniref:rhodanese-like domain-containing protein n=2 Tax=Roseobacteraceae TaxID=2854170 RepID=UPI001FB30731|nr:MULTISPECIES: rhodanese-like domain-containing protein [Shimia]MDV4145597.1 rhodanese-like domain-containing protein [Shimia sp. FJ5]